MIYTKGKFSILRLGIQHIVILVLVLASIMSCLILAFDTSSPGYYKYLFLLPLSFSVICILFIRIHKIRMLDIGFWLIILLYFIRNTVTPLILKLGDYSELFNITSLNNINKAIALMSYETIIVIFMIYVNIRSNLERRKYYKLSNVKRINLANCIIFLLVLFCTISYLTIPEIGATYNSVFNIRNIVNDNYSIASQNIEYGSIKRIVFSLTLFLIPVLQICLPIVLFIKIRKRFGEKKKALILSFLCVFLNFLLISDNNIDILIITLILTMILIKLYPKYSDLIIKGIGTFILTGVVVIFWFKFNSALYFDNNIFVSLSRSFQAYFQGVGNVAGIFNVDFSNKMSTLFFDFYTMIPFRNTIFSGLNIIGNGLVVEFCKSNNVVAQIVPCIAQAYYYLGFFIAPIIPAMLTYWAIIAQKKSQKEQNIFRYACLLQLTIYLGLATAVNNFTIFGTYFLNFILPLYIISIFTGNNSKFINIINTKKREKVKKGSDELENHNVYYER